MAEGVAGEEGGSAQEGTAKAVRLSDTAAGYLTVPLDAVAGG
jgi:hypothetical protein